MHTLTISPIRAFSDNYIWLIVNGNQGVVVDPGETQPVLDALTKIGVNLVGILVTHHHFDHTGAVADLQQRTGCAVWGPYNSPAGPYEHNVAEGDAVSVLGAHFNVLEVPGHTLDHIAYYSETEQAVFCGDTLFVGGCGRVFEGSPPQMRASLEKLVGLPPETRVFCAHEYTLANLDFATLVEPDNPDLKEFLAICQQLRARNEPTVPSRIGAELSYNPFLRWNSASIRQTLYAHDRLSDDTPDAIFAAVREWKNTA